MVDEIDRVGPGGHFLDTEATFRGFKDFWYPNLIDRQRRPEWLASGGTTLGQRLTARVREIVQEHRAKPLDPASQARIQEILAQAATP